MCNFTHLHVHTEYSLLDGLSNIKKLVAKAQEYNMESVAISDHGVMYGAIEFYQACAKQDVKPIIGMEAYVMKGDTPHTDKDPKSKTNANHLLLLAKNMTGYRNLMELTSIAHLDGFYYKPRFDKKTLQKYSEGIICTSACPAGELAETIINADYDAAKEVVNWYRDLFKDDYYLEIQKHQYELFLPHITEPEIKQDLERMMGIEKKLNETIIKLSKELSVPLIATNDAHYIDQQDAPAQDALVCVSTGTTVDTIKRLRYIDTPTFHFRSGDEMKELFPEVPEALSQTVEIAKQCDLDITLGEWFFPKLPDLPEDKSEEELLRQQLKERLPTRYPEVTDEINKRIDFELDTICTKGYAGYFLIMAEFARWTRSQGIFTNTRGSAAGSIVSYILGITTVDPIKYYLPFERFLNPFRPSPPDIDLDIADNRRIDMIQYITERFGQDKVAQICTFGRMMARGAVKDIARVLNYPYEFGDRVSKMIPEGSQGFPMSIDRGLEESPELKELYDGDPDVKRVMDLSRQVEGSARHISIHAAAVVVAPEKITHFSPLQRETKGDKIITQYEMHAAEDVGLIKFDILGITNLTILDAAIVLVEKTTGTKIEIDKIPIDDTKTFEMLARGETIGVFQLAGSGMTKCIMDMKPNRVEDLMAALALYRPGPIANIPEYIARKHGQSEVIYMHPKMEKFLAPSYGILVYQDDLLFTAIELAGYNWEEVDKFRKAVGKKIPEEMAKQHIKFVKGCQEHSQMTEAEAEAIWEQFEPFQGYGFNKAHAASYGMVSYYTAYMKANFPVEYMTATLTADAGSTDKVAAGVAEARKMEIKVLAPEINTSETEFTVEESEDSLNNKAIRFGLNAIKNVGEAAILAILEERSNKQFTGLVDFFNRVDGRKVNKKVVESLIKAGAFDQFGKRAALLAGVDELRKQAEAAKKKRASGQVDMFASLSGESTSESDANTENLPDVPEFSPEEKLKLEKELLGFYLTDNPLKGKLKALQLVITHHIDELLTAVEKNTHTSFQNKTVKLGAVITDCRVVITKKTGKQMAFATIADETGSLDAVIFPNTYAESKEYWITDQAVLVQGKLEVREGQPSFIVDRVVSAESQIKAPADPSQTETANQSGHTLVVPRNLDRNKLISLNQLLKSAPGDDHLTLVFQNGTNGGKHVPVPFTINYSPQLQKQAMDLLAT